MHEQIIQEMIDCEDDADSWRELFERTRDSTAAGPHHVSLVDVGADEIVLEMPVGDHARQVSGLLHGGVSAFLAETAASMHACWGVDLSERAPVGIELNATHLRSATDGTVRAVGTVLHRGDTHVQHRVDIRHVERETVLSECRVTNYLRARE